MFLSYAVFFHVIIYSFWLVQTSFMLPCTVWYSSMMFKLLFGVLPIIWCITFFDVFHVFLWILYIFLHLYVCVVCECLCMFIKAYSLHVFVCIFVYFLYVHVFPCAFVCYHRFSWLFHKCQWCVCISCVHVHRSVLCMALVFWVYVFDRLLVCALLWV